MTWKEEITPIVQTEYIRVYCFKPAFGKLKMGLVIVWGMKKCRLHLWIVPNTKKKVWLEMVSRWRNTNGSCSAVVENLFKMSEIYCTYLMGRITKLASAIFKLHTSHFLTNKMCDNDQIPCGVDWLKTQQCVERAFRGMGFPWQSSCIQAIDHKVQCKGQFSFDFKYCAEIKYTTGYSVFFRNWAWPLSSSERKI